MKKSLAAILVLAFCLDPIAWGATIKLKDGSELEGEIVSKGKTMVKIKIEGGLELEIDGDKIESVDGEKYTVDVRAAYEEQLQQMDDSNADEHFRMAEWCRERALRTESKMHLRKALEIDPMHKGVNLALNRVYIAKENKWMDRHEARKKGYAEIKGKGEWVTEKEALAARGLKEYKGYMLSEAEIEAMKAREIKRFKGLYYTHSVCELKGEILRIDFWNKCKFTKDQMEELYPTLLEGEHKRQFFIDQIHEINARVEVAYNRLKEEGIKGVYSGFDRPPGVEAAAGAAEYEIVDIKKGFVQQMTPLAERLMKTMKTQSGARTKKGSTLFKLDHDYCMCCHKDMSDNSECKSCHRGGRDYGHHPAEMAAVMEIRNMPGKEWVAQKEKIMQKWCRPIPPVDNGKPLPKSEIKRRQMMERASIETLFTEVRDYPATDFERSKEMLAAKLACKDASNRVRIEAKVLGERRHKLSHSVKTNGMIVSCFFNGTLFDFASIKLGKKKEKLLRERGAGTGLVEQQTVINGKADFEEYCSFCHPLERVMVRVRMGSLGAAMWSKGVPMRLRYFKGAWSKEEWDKRVAAIVDHILDLESKYAEKKGKKDEF